MLDSDEGIVRLADADQLVELDLDRGTVAVLRVLDEKDHQEGHDRRAGVDHQLPGIGIMKYRTRGRPNDHGAYGNYERERSPGPLGRAVSDFTEELGRL